MRLTACDRGNDWGGKVQIFWGIDKPIVVGSDALFAFTKLGRYMLEQGEGWLFRSDNILTRNRPGQDPLGAAARRASTACGATEFGSVQEEHNVVPLGDGSLYCVWRTTTGASLLTPTAATAAAPGPTPEPMTYTPGGRVMKNAAGVPQGCGGPPTASSCSGSTTTRPIVSGPQPGVDHRRRGAGRPHPLVAARDPPLRSRPERRMSYPDLIEQDGRYWVTETQKTIARVHEVDPALLEGLWSQGRSREISRRGLVLDLPAEKLGSRPVALPARLDVSAGGLAVEFWTRLEGEPGDQVILDTRDDAGRGLVVVAGAGTAACPSRLHDGNAKAAWSSDQGRLRVGKQQHVVINVDPGPRIISMVVDGLLCDGGTGRQRGWGRFEGPLGDVSGSGRLRAGAEQAVQLARVRIYNRYLRVSEAVAHYHAGP